MILAKDTITCKFPGDSGIMNCSWFFLTLLLKTQDSVLGFYKNFAIWKYIENSADLASGDEKTNISSLSKDVFSDILCWC